MKKILSFIIAGLFAGSAFAQTFVTTSLTANTPASAVAAKRATVTSITATATTASTTTIYLYDSADTNTYVITPAYTSTTSYSTNWDATFTNQAGVLVTNTFSGIYTTTAAVGAATNEKTRRITLVVPGNTQRTYSITSRFALGVAALADENAILELTYRQ